MEENFNDNTRLVSNLKVGDKLSIGGRELITTQVIKASRGENFIIHLEVIIPDIDEKDPTLVFIMPSDFGITISK